MESYCLTRQGVVTSMIDNPNKNTTSAGGPVIAKNAKNV